MASDQKFVTSICEQLSHLGRISSRKIFGEYALYYAQTVVALVCDNQLFVKPTAAGRALLGKPVEAAPYPGAKPHLLIDEALEDAEALSRLIAATALELEVSKEKTGKKRRSDGK